MVVKQWHHTCCYRHTSCYRANEEDAWEHASEREDHLRTAQNVRFSERMKKWVIENVPT